MNEIILKPLITEKMTSVTDKFSNRYGFIVMKDASKGQIKNAVETLYNVNVVTVNTMIYTGKSKSRGTRRGFIQGRTSTFKKAIVTLKDKQEIDFFSNV